MTLNKIKKVIKELDDKIKETDEGFKCAVVLLALTEKPQRIKDIAEFTQIERPLVARFMKNFRANKIIRNGKIRHSGWFDKESGGIAFWIDVSCGLGFLQRTSQQAT